MKNRQPGDVPCCPYTASPDLEAPGPSNYAAPLLPCVSSNRHETQYNYRSLPHWEPSAVNTLAPAASGKWVGLSLVISVSRSVLPTRIKAHLIRTALPGTPFQR